MDAPALNLYGRSRRNRPKRCPVVSNSIHKSNQMVGTPSLDHEFSDSCPNDVLFTYANPHSEAEGVNNRSHFFQVFIQCGKISFVHKQRKGFSENMNIVIGIFPATHHLAVPAQPLAPSNSFRDEGFGQLNCGGQPVAAGEVCGVMAAEQAQPVPWVRMPRAKGAVRSNSVLPSKKTSTESGLPGGGRL